MENINDIISSAVSDALDRNNVSGASNQRSEGESSERKCRNRKRRPAVLPSSFLQKKKKGNSSALQVWDRDILCFPKKHVKCPQEISIPRGKTRVTLAKMGLVGKIRLHSGMQEEDIMAEIRSVFASKMSEDPVFPFKILQAIGGGSKSLAVPNTSSSFVWTPKEVANSAGKGAIYVWAQADFTCNPDEEHPGHEWMYVTICMPLSLLCYLLHLKLACTLGNWSIQTVMKRKFY